MRTETRRERILERLRQDGQVQVRDLVTLFDVSEMTIRRDLESLAAEGALLRTYGGATLATAPVREQPYVEKAVAQTAEKHRIAHAAAGLVQDGQVILLDAGSTNAALAKALRGRKELTVVTVDLQIAVELCNEPAIRVIMTGGIVQPQGYNLYGPQAEASLRGLTVDFAFLGTSAVDVERGITTPTLEKVPLKQGMLTAARHSVLLADSSKFGRRSTYQISPLCDVGRIITDSSLSQDMARAIRKEGVPLELV